MPIQAAGRPEILVVDDRPENILAISRVLEDQGADILTATSGNDALALTLEHDFALVLLDVQMPGMDGFETAALMRGDIETRHIPIIFVTAISKEKQHVSKGYTSGAVDYLFKPLDPDILRNKVKVFVDLYSRRKQIEEQNALLNGLALHDGLTGLFNRRHMEEILKKEFGRAARYGTDLSCLLMDLDFFKDVNDTYGHCFGDLVLKEFSTILKTNFRDSDFAFRYGGEEFMVLLPQTAMEGARKSAEKIRTICQNKTYQDANHTAAVTVSIGLATVNAHKPQRPEDLLAYADKALYMAKAAGRDRVVVYGKKSDTYP